MFRLLAPVGLALVMLTGCSGGGCHGVEMSIAAGAVGQASPSSALNGFLSSREAPADLPKSGWASVGAGVYRSGASRVTVQRLANRTYVVTEAQTC